MIKYKKINQILKEFLPGIKLINVRHHIAHAVSAYNSGFEESNILVMMAKVEKTLLQYIRLKRILSKKYLKQLGLIVLDIFIKLQHLY